ncbi:MAG: hypothetical protein LBG90_07885, partial [Spirochaetaceae bacterium]|nr:hypothetical protein [Spirochaetaceae bacterium]
MKIMKYKENQKVHFSFYKNSIDDLMELDKNLFKNRPDLILGIGPTSDYMFSDEELSSLTKLQNVKKLYLTGFKNKSLEPISELKNIIGLELYAVNQNEKLDISFIGKMNLLESLKMTCKIDSLEPIQKCNNLKQLHLSTRIEDFTFLEPLNKIEIIGIQGCYCINDFSLINKESLKELHLASVHTLENIDTIQSFQSINKLCLDASKVKMLPDMSKLVTLKELDLRLKTWENPEILKTLPNLERLRLREINTKLEAEKFYFLTKIKTLKEIDFRFID